MYVCASVSLDTFRRSLALLFSLLSRKGYTESLVTQAERTRPLENSTSLWLLHPYFFFCYYNPAPRRSRSSLDSSVVSLRCFSPLARRSSGFNFVHFCFLNYLLVSSIRDGDSSTFVGFYFLVYSSVNRLNLDCPLIFLASV